MRVPEPPESKGQFERRSEALRRAGPPPKVGVRFVKIVGAVGDAPLPFARRRRRLRRAVCVTNGNGLAHRSEFTTTAANLAPGRAICDGTRPEGAARGRAKT